MIVSRATAVAAVAGAFAAVVVLASEVVEWQASRRMLGRAVAVGGDVDLDRRHSEAIVVLGFGNTGTRPNAVNRFRVRIALRSVNPTAARTVLICSGGGVHSVVPEARLLAVAAREAGWHGEIVIEDGSRNTAENIDNSAPLVEGFDVVRIASNPLHALKAREYARRHHPGLAERLAPADDHRWGEALWLKPAAAVVAWAGLTRRRRRARSNL